jgi:hypothetical protein
MFFKIARKLDHLKILLESVKCDLKKWQVNIIYLILYIFNLTTGKMVNTIAHQRTCSLKVEKPVEVPVKKIEFYLVTQSL